MPQTTLSDYNPDDGDLSSLTPVEREAYVAVERGDRTVREWMREQGYSSPGTVSNLLRRARSKIDGGEPT